MEGPLTVLRKWCLRDTIDEYSDEAIDDSVSVSTEMVCIGGERIVLRRVFVRIRGCSAYSRVGWVLLPDCPRCMICSALFPTEGEGVHCCACGNVVCSRCGSESAAIQELLDVSHSERVCSLCYWGQDIVSAVLRPPTAGLLFSPAAASSPPARLSITGGSMRGTDPENISGRAPSPSVSDSDDDDHGALPRVVGVAARRNSPAVLELEPLQEAGSAHRSQAYLLHSNDPGTARAAVKELVEQAGRLDTAQWSSMSVELEGHVLDCIATLAALKGAAKAPVRSEVFKAVVQHLYDRAQAVARGITFSESFPMTWIHEKFPAMTGVRRHHSWLPLHWCGALSEADSPLGASHLTGLLHEDPSLVLMDDRNEVSVLSLAVAKARPNLSFVETLLSVESSAAAVPDRDGALPLMYAAAWNETLTVLSKLYDCYPAAVSETDAFGYTPLHFACYAGTLDAVRFLLAKDPRGASKRNNAGSLPLHACAANTRHGGAQMARVLCESWPDAVSSADGEGSLPLHVAAQYADVDQIRYLYDKYPDAATQANDEGLLPMHMAGLRKLKSVDILNLLTEFAQNNYM